MTRLGGWTVRLTPTSVDDLGHGGRTVVSRVAFAVRDQRWASERIPVSYGSPEHERDGTTSVSFVGSSRSLGARLSGKISVHEATLRLSFRFEVASRLAVSRAGPYVLHAVPFAGAVVADGGRDRAVITQDVMPTVPLSGYSSLQYDVDGQPVTVRFEGARFEMEDQRGWGDAAFKSYCPPLDEPRPIVVMPEAPMEYVVALDVGPAAHAPSPPRGWVQRRVRLPALGFRYSDSMSQDMVDRMRTVRPDFLHLFADLAASGWEDRLASGLGVCAQLGALAVVTASVPLSARTQLRHLAHADTVLVFDAESPRTSEELAEAARAALPHATLGGGSRGFLTGLLRDGGASAALDVVAFPVSAAVHESDHSSWVSGTTSYPDLLRTAGRLAAGRPVFVGPVGLHPVFNSWDPPASRAWTAGPVASDPDVEGTWLMLALARLAEAGATTVSLGTTPALLEALAALPYRSGSTATVRDDGHGGVVVTQDRTIVTVAGDGAVAVPGVGNVTGPALLVR